MRRRKTEDEKRLRREKYKVDPVYRAQHAISRIKRTDAFKGHVNDLTVPFIAETYQCACYYCQRVEETITLDRKDNSQGHYQDNIVPACITCNVLRGDMPFELWMEFVPLLLECRERRLLEDWQLMATKPPSLLEMDSTMQSSNIEFVKPYHRDIPECDLLGDLRRVASEFGKNSISQNQYNADGEYGASTFVRRFGSWNRAKELAGLETDQRQEPIISRNELFENLLMVNHKLGRLPSYSEVEKPLSKYGVGTYCNRFGSWRKALQTFQDWANENNVELSLPEASEVVREPRGISRRMRVLALDRDGHRCVSCGRSPPEVRLEVDHIVARSQGGKNMLDNYQTHCHDCNSGKSDLSIPGHPL